MRFLALLLALALLLCACASSDGENNRKDDDDDDRRTEHREDDEDEGEERPGGMDGLDSWGDDKDEADEQEELPNYRVADVLFEPVYGGSSEYAMISGVDEDGELVWSTMTMVYDAAQLCQVTGIGLWNDRYYYVEGGSVVALDRETGSILWENADFGGCPANGDRACMILEDGTLYLTGYFGPDFMALDRNGNPIVRLATLHPDYYWPHTLTLEGDRLTITMEGGPEGSWEYFIALDTETWEVVE